MKWRTATGKILLGLAGTVGVALVVFVVAPWSQAPAPPVSPVSPDEIIEEVMGPLGENDGEAADEADAVAGVLPEGEETVSPALGPVAQPVEEGGEDQEIVGVLPAPLTPDEVASAILEPSATDEEGGDEAVEGEAVAAAVNQFAEAVLERLDEIVHASVGSAPSVEEDEVETPGPEPEQVIEPVPAEAAVETVERQAEPPPEVVEDAPDIEPVMIERDMRVEFSMPVEEVAAASTGPPSGAPVAPEGPAPPLGPLEPPAREPDWEAAGLRPSVVAAVGLAELRRAEAVTAPHVPRGAMGYRLPLVSRQELPIQVVSGVVMPAHHTYVILRPGHWELLTEGGEIVVPAEPVEAVVEEPEPEPRRGWNPLNLFRRRTPAGEE